MPSTLAKQVNDIYREAAGAELFLHHKKPGKKQQHEL